jgi:hypothetical protein
VQGFLTLAHSDEKQEPGGSLVHDGSLRNTQTKNSNYLQMAYLQCLSVKLLHPEYPFAVITDKKSFFQQPEKIQKAFDHIIFIDENRPEDKRRIDWQMYDLSPFDETIKAEADLVYTRSTKNWWYILEKSKVAFSIGARNCMGELSNVRKYRKQFDDAFLPDVYTGLMYWKKSELAKSFFDLTRKIYQNWNEIKVKLQTTDPGSNDFIFGLAAKNFPQITNQFKFFNLIHMKPGINSLDESKKWFEEFQWSINAPEITINNVKQLYPLHYFEKDWVTEDLIQKYETALANRSV